MVYVHTYLVSAPGKLVGKCASPIESTGYSGLLLKPQQTQNKSSLGTFRDYHFGVSKG